MHIIAAVVAEVALAALAFVAVEVPLVAVAVLLEPAEFVVVLAEYFAVAQMPSAA